MAIKVSPEFSERGRSNIEAIMPKIKGAVEERKSKTSSNIDLSTAENWLIRPELMEICKEAINQDLTAAHFSYARGFAGDPDLLDALASFFNTRFNPFREVQASHLSVAPGASGCIDAILHNICNPGDGVLIPGPYWNGFDFGLRARASVTPVLAPLPSFEANFNSESLLEGLEAAMKSAPCPIKALVLTNPHNPLGCCYTKPVLEICVRFCKRHDIHFVSDEVYAISQFDNGEGDGVVPFTSALSLDLENIGGDPSRTHVVWSMSKDFGQSGFRMGCAVTQSNEEMVVGLALAAMQQISSLSAIFTTHLLRSNKLPELISLNSERLSISYGMLTNFFKECDIPYLPCTAGLYVYAKLAKSATTWEDEAKMVQQLKDVGVIVSGGKAYHGPESEKGWARVGFSVEVTALEDAISRMRQVLR
ncbi:PLP-dependent transferase [Polyplosphaeria fusca]|uniref:PLP-dependent transferase n=1 Tax=Polyplosphaeria fusca TaxID=682080 RepID=A0A9P4QQK9_9PLEO|nr:PLP-dependent transferase [Polyplosphaeria fusca]